MIYVPDGAAQERDKYAEIWSIEEYRTAESPGEQNVQRFMDVVNPPLGSSLLDIGCGAGRAGLDFVSRGLAVHWMDITDAALDPAIDRARFIESPIWGSLAGKWDYGFCCDVLEHLPTEYTMAAIDRILAHCSIAWLQISLRSDEFGKLIGEPLHLTVRPFDWWLLRIATLGRVSDARDLCGAALYVVSR
jgi:SAM-dependent methyltransferase